MKICILFEKYMLIENIDFGKRYANRKYVWCFQKYTLIKKTFMEIKWIYMFLDKY